MIDLSGEWVHHPTRGYRDWRGTITAPFEWLGVALLRIGATVSWTKSSAIDAPAMPHVRLLISPPEDAIGTSISFGIAGTVAQYNLPTMDPELVVSMPSHVQFYPEKVFWLSAPEAVDLGLGGIIVRRDDTERLRKGLWRLKGVTGSISSALRDMLAYGRVGKIALACLESE